MAKAVFITKVDPTYDDLPEDRYHFPKTYLNQDQQTIGDWIVYYEPRRPSGDLGGSGGRQVYFAMAQVREVVTDSNLPDHYYAYVAPETYRELFYPVPFKEDTFYYESALQKEDGSTNKGAFGRAVRLIPDDEFELIIKAGFAPVINDIKENTMLKVPEYAFSDQEQEEFTRPIIEQIIRKPFREASFSKLVKGVYQQTCALTGLKVINGGGRSEVEAAHIMPVAENGPDTIRNGLALSRTMHWIFDRGLISVDDDYSILKAKGKIPESVDQLLNPDGHIILPDTSAFLPHKKYLHFHRENIFKG